MSPCQHSNCPPPVERGERLLRTPGVRRDRVDAMAEGTELFDRGRRWVRLPGGRPVLVADVWSGFSLEPEWSGRGTDPSGLPATERGESAPVELAINSPSLFHYEDEGERRYGSAANIVEDCERWGAGVIRHPGKAQLFLDFLLKRGRADDDPATEDTIEPSMVFSYPAVAERVWSSTALNNLLILAPLLRDREMSTFVTLLTLGGGGAYSKEPGNDVVEGVAGQVRSSPSLLWGEAWLDDGISLVDDRTGEVLPFQRLSSTWDLETMDPGNACKRLVYRWVCRAVGEWLEEHRDELEGVIAGIEIGNELEVRHTFTPDDKDRQVCPQHWGLLFAECAVEVRERCPWVPLWLPGVASYAQDGEVGSRSPTEFWGKVTFLEDMISTIQSRLDSFGTSLLLKDIVAGVDLHWYHTDQSSSRRVVLLPLELQAVREAIEEAVSRTSSAGHAVDLTLIEAGGNMLCSLAEKKTDAASGEGQCEGESFDTASAHLRPPWYAARDRSATWVSTELHAVRLADQVGGLDWQAWSLARQLMMALVGGVRVIGNHGHISTKPESPFAGYGIRRDLFGVNVPGDADLRPAGAMLHRLAEVFGGLTGEVKMEFPKVEPAEGETLRDTAGKELESGTWPIENFAIVLAFQGLYTRRRTRWGFGRQVGGFGTVLFVDSVAGSNEPSDRTPGAMVVRLLYSSNVTVWRLPLEVSRMWSVPLGEDDFPDAMVRYDSLETVETTFSESIGYRTLDVPIARGAAPILLFSSGPATVERVFVLPEFGS